MSLEKPEVKSVGAAATSAGVAVVATAASACCVPIVAPLIVAILGASGAAWAAGLEPYSVYILLGSLVVLAYGFWSLSRARRACEDESCSTSGRNPFANRVAGLILWVAALLWLGAAALNVYQFLGS